MKPPRQEGKGNLVTVTRRPVPRPDGTTTVELAINLMEAGVPDRRYFADTTSIQVDPDFIRISFGQSQPAGRHTIIIVLTIEAIRSLLRHVGDFLKVASGYMEKNKISRRPLLGSMPESTQTVTMVANMVAIAQSGRECCVDFYHLSAWGMRNAQAAREVDVDPVVRVDTTTSLVVPLLEYIMKLQDELPPEAL